jgi:oligopeptide transport system substrate-binding protein
MAEFVTHHTMYPVPRHLVEAKGAEWTKAGTFISNGPYLLKDWIPNDHLTLTKNAKFYDAPNVKIDTVNYYPTPDGDSALKRFRAGELDTQDPIRRCSRLPARQHARGAEDRAGC